MAVTFRSKVLQAEGMNATGIPVPDDAVAALGTSRNPPVVVTIGDYSYRTSVATRDDRFMLSLSAANRAAAGVVAGDELEVTLELDDQPRTMEMPDDLEQALQSAGALEAFTALSYSKQRGHIDPINDAKTPETRQRRIEKTVAAMTPGPR